MYAVQELFFGGLHVFYLGVELFLAGCMYLRVELFLGGCMYLGVGGLFRAQAKEQN